jgi:gas vesicle protein
MERKDYTELGIGFLVGALVGGVFALLYAPKKGSETREIIRNKAVEVRDTVRDNAGKFIKRVK